MKREMMVELKKQYDLWSEFLTVWPEARLREMKLDEYTKAGSKDTFTYWIEARLDKMGSMWGGSAFKFGIFSRKDVGEKSGDQTLSYSADYAWYTALGDTAEQAFEQVRQGVVQVARYAAQGDLDAIESMDIFGEVYRWKIAFHYQDRQNPRLVNIFTRAPLKALIDDSAFLDANMASLQRAVVADKPENMGILEYGRLMWETWSRQNLAIWKLSHGNGSFTKEEQQQYREKGLAMIYGDTGKSQGKKFENAPIGTLFYLCNSNSPQLVGQFTSAAQSSPKDAGWLQRNYRVLKLAIRTDPYTDSSKGWSPSYRSTFYQVGKDDLALFDHTLLQPYFGISLAELASLAGEPLDAMTASTVPADSDFDTDEKLLSRFDGKASFKEFRRTWSAEYRALFVRLARVVHDAGLDWWHMGKGVQVRFGRKNPHDRKAAGVLGVVRGKEKQKITWTRPVGEMEQCHRKPLSEELVSTIERAFAQSNEALDEWLAVDKARPGWWPDQLDAESNEPGFLDDDVEDEDDEGDELLPIPVRQTFNRIYYGPPGTGKTHQLLQLLKQTYTTSDDNGGVAEHYSLVTFHQSYGYEEFVEGLRPVLDVSADGQIRYEIRPGVFKRLCEDARRFPEQQFAMVIDEINRGNISKIFGELITLIEVDKREGAKNVTKVTLPYSGEQFSIPANVDIIGSMNTADRSLALVDTALRRRFDFVPRMPNSKDEIDAPLYALRVTLGEKSIDIPSLLSRINQRIESLYDRDHTIGHAYFMELGDAQDGMVRFERLEHIFRNRIIPLLEEYFFEDWEKIRLILGDNQKAMSGDQRTCFILVDDDQEGELVQLFGASHGLEAFGTRRRYALNDLALSNPDAYIGIYLGAR
ncbi:5-methylcytosine-specific restriction endonuclease McrBC GTP-binding regulatory subunit McrB [Massilia sp. UYP11]|uniref:McrB family protein n=1 Tax=Massilia sp. UYP11 TaxID=1756385 RepID=UPI003D244448